MMRETRIRDRVKQTLTESGWNEEDLLEEQILHFRQKTMCSDIVLLHNLYPMAVVETIHPSEYPLALTGAADQASEQAEAIGVSFAYATDGERIIQSRLPGGEEQLISRFPSPSDLWTLLRWEWDEDDPRLFPPYRVPGMTPRIHHAQAVSKTVDAILNGQKRVLVSMAVGSGVMYVAFQIAWKLLQSGSCRRALHVVPSMREAEAARQAYQPFDEDLLVLTRASARGESGGLLSAARLHIGTSMYFAGPDGTSRLQQFASDLYDLIIVTNAEGVVVTPLLKHFKKAIAVGFTSLPVRGVKLSDFDGDVSYRYSLEEALETETLLDVPEGFKTVHLDEIAAMQIGAQVGKTDTPEEPEEGFYVVSARDLGREGVIHPQRLSRIKVKDTRAVVGRGKINPRYLLQADDILLARVHSGADVRVGIVPQNLRDPIAFSSSLIRIRVDPELADPKDVFAFLRSDSGKLVVRRFASKLGTGISRISASELGQIPISLPTTPRARETAQEKLGAVSRTKQRLQGEILPLMEELEQVDHGGTEDYNRQLNSIAVRLRSLADILAQPTLAERVMTDYPTPLALAYRRFHDARFNVYERVLRLRDVFEATAYYVYNLLLADLLRRLDPVTYYIEDPGARRAYNGYSMSARMDLVQEVLRIAQANQGEDLFIPELVGSSVAALAKELQEDLRNRLSHTATATESQQRQVLADFEPIVEGMLSELEFLNRYQLVRVTSYFYERDRLFRRLELYHGVVPEVDEQVFPHDTELTRANRNHLVLLDAEGQVLDLHPLYQLVASEQTRYENHLCFFKQRKKAQKLLEGESVEGAFPIQLAGFQRFESLQSRIPGRRSKE